MRLLRAVTFRAAGSMSPLFTVRQDTFRSRPISSYADLRKNGWKTVSLLNTYISDTLHNKMYQIMFDKVGNAIVSGAANYINASDTMPTQDAMEAMALYMAEHSDGEGVIIGLTKYIQAIGKLKGYQSNEMLNELYQTGFHKYFDGHPLKAINSSKKLGDGSMLISDKVLYGVCGKIGSLDMRGESVHTRIPTTRTRS